VEGSGGQSVLGPCSVFDTPGLRVAGCGYGCPNQGLASESELDKVTLPGGEFFGSDCPEGQVLQAGDTVTWHSDGSIQGSIDSTDRQVLASGCGGHNGMPLRAICNDYSGCGAKNLCGLPEDGANLGGGWEICLGDSGGSASAGASGGGGASPPPSPEFLVNSGPCEVLREGLCVGRPSGYSNSERCSITVSGSTTLGACPVFRTEAGYDWLTIGGADYHGSNCPMGVTVQEGAQIDWVSDGSVAGDGWEICAEDGNGR